MGTGNLIEWIDDVADNTGYDYPESLEDLQGLIRVTATFGQFQTRDALADYYARMITYRDGEWDLEVNVHVGDA